MHKYFPNTKCFCQTLHTLSFKYAEYSEKFMIELAGLYSHTSNLNCLNAENSFNHLAQYTSAHNCVSRDLLTLLIVMKHKLRCSSVVTTYPFITVFTNCKHIS